MVAGCLFLALQLSLAQTTAHKPATSSAENTRAILVRKRRTPLKRAAGPTWPSSCGSRFCSPIPTILKRWPGWPGSEADRLRQSAGSAGSPAQGESERSEHCQDRRHWPARATRAHKLRQAGELARQGKVDDAMRIYRQLYGDHPPDGDIALAYYQTLYGTANGKQEAIAGMRALAERNPGDPRFAVELGIMLTYDAEDARRRHSHTRGASQGLGGAGCIAPGAGLGLGQSGIGGGAARIPEGASAGHGTCRPFEGRRSASWRR